jgi:hypothetical protein
MLATGSRTESRSRLRQAVRRRREGLLQIVLVGSAIQVYEGFRRLIDPNWPAAMENARRIADLERVLHLGWEKPVQQAFLGLPEVVEAMNVFYFVGHFLLTGIFFFWLYHRSRPGFRLFRDGFLTATALALIVHWGFPTAPPRLAGMGLVDTLRQLSDIDIGSDAASTYYNPVAAVPSLHAGYAFGVGIGLALFARRRAARALGLVYPLAVLLTIVVTGNHFVFDAIAGIAVMGLGFLAVWLVRRLRPLARPRLRKRPAILAHATRGGAVR